MINTFYFQIKNLKPSSLASIYQKWSFPSKELSETSRQTIAASAALFILSAAAYWTYQKLTARAAPQPFTPPTKATTPPPTKIAQPPPPPTHNSLEQKVKTVVGLYNNETDSEDEAEYYDAEDSLDRLKSALSKYTFTCKLLRNGKTQEIPFVNYLFQSIIRETELSDCSLDATSTKWTFTYSDSKTIKFQKLPQSAWDKMHWGVRSVVSQLLKVAPGMEISQTLEVQITEEGEGMKMTFRDGDISLTQNSLKYTGYFKSILFVNNRVDNNDHHLVIETEHNSRLGDKEGSFDHQMLAEILDCNIFPEHYPNKA
jgi:hypothetical protein